MSTGAQRNAGEAMSGTWHAQIEIGVSVVGAATISYALGIGKVETVMATRALSIRIKACFAGKPTLEANLCVGWAYGWVVGSCTSTSAFPCNFIEKEVGI